MTTAPDLPVAPAAPAAPAAPTSAEVAGREHPTAILAIICVGYFMVILDNSIIFTALPQIETAMRFSPTGLTWVQDAYTLVFGGLLLLGARAGDLAGRRRMFVLGLVLFGAASLLVGAAQSSGWLIGARALQGVGAAILAPSSLSLLTASFPEGAARRRAVAAYSAVAGIGASAGLVVGGVLADWVSWRAGFLLNVPIGLAMIVATRRYVAETETHRGRFDLAGAVLATLGVGAIVFGIIDAAEVGWGSATTVGSLAVGVVLLVGLVVNEARVEQPIMPLRLFADRTRVGAYLVRMLYLGAMIGFFFFTTQYLQGVLGFSALEAGFAFLPMTAVNFVVAVRATPLARRYGDPAVLAAGVLATLVGMAWLSRVSPDSSYVAAVALPMVLVGLGQGLAFAPMTSAALAGVPGEDAGASSGILNTFHQLGSALGLGILVVVSADAASGSTSAAGLTERVTAALSGSSVFLALALVLVLALIAGRPGPRLTATTT